MRLTAPTILLIVLLCLGIPPLHASTHIVTDCSAQAGLRETIANASRGDTIMFACGRATIPFTYPIAITKDVTIHGEGIIRLDGGRITSFFEVRNGVTLTIIGMTLQNGSGKNRGGGAIVNYGGKLTLINSTFLHNVSKEASGDRGGAIRHIWGDLTIIGSTFIGNMANYGGGAIYHERGNIVIGDTTFIGNQSGYGGVIMSDNSTLLIRHSTFAHNSGRSAGGVIDHNGRHSLVIGDSLFWANRVTSLGGAISSGYGQMDISHSVFGHNRARRGDGGAVMVTGRAHLRVIHTTFVGNRASQTGGAMSNLSGIITIDSSFFVANRASSGGAISHERYGGYLGIMNSRFSHNRASDYNGRGGVIVNSGIGSISHSTFTHNRASGLYGTGGVLFNDGVMTITDSRMSQNRALYVGGAIANTGVVNMTTTSLTNNEPSRFRTIIQNISRRFMPDAPPRPPLLVYADTVRRVDNTPTCTVTGQVMVAGVADTLFCRVLMQNGVVVEYAGAVPADLMALGVILAIELEAIGTIPDFGGYRRVCLAGSGRLFYLDARQAPRVVNPLTTDVADGVTCGWIPAIGTVVLTN